MERGALAALVLLALLAGALATPAVASPQPRPVCGYCGAEFASAAADRGIEVEVAESTAVVRVHEDGSATWTVRNRLSTGAEAFRDDPELLDSVADKLREENRGLPDDVDSVDARMDGDTVVLTVRGHDAASRRAGVLVVDFLHEGNRQPWYVVNADRFTVRGPEGSVVTNDPASGRVDDGAVTWSGSGSDLWDSPRLTGSPYVAFGPDRSAGTLVRTHAALVFATLPLVVGSVLDFVLLPTLVFAFLLAGVALVVRALARREDDEGKSPDGDAGTGSAAESPAAERGWNRLAVAITAVGGALAVLLLLAGHVILAGPALFGLGLGMVGLLPALRSNVRTPRRLAAVAAATLFGTFAVVLLVGAVVGPPYREPVDAALRGTVLALPIAAAFALGGALDADRRRQVAWGGLAVVSFAAVLASQFDPGNPPGGLAAGLLTVFGFVQAVVYPLVGAPVLALGRSFVEPGPGQ